MKKKEKRSRSGQKQVLFSKKSKSINHDNDPTRNEDCCRLGKDLLSQKYYINFQIQKGLR